MKITVDRTDSFFIYRQIESAIKKQILNNELAYGVRLPSERGLADSLGVARTTITKAYQLLVDQGLVSCGFNGKRGYFVIFDGYEEDGSLKEVKHTKRTVFSYIYDVKRNNRIFNTVYRLSFDDSITSFGCHIISENLVCLDEIKEVMNKTVDAFGKEAFYYCLSNGNPLLRKQLAVSLRDEGIEVKPNEVVIINDSPQGLEYVSSILAKEKDYIVSEAPIIPDTYSIFTKRGYNVLLAECDETGVSLTYLENLFKKYKPKFFHTMPDYHGVTNVRMPLEKRIRLLELADKYNVPIIEERWFWGIDFDEKPILSLFALDKSQNVIQIDDVVSKFYYGAKIGYVLAPAELASRISLHLSEVQVHLQNLVQLMFMEYLKSGYDDPQRKLMSDYYRDKYLKMEAAMAPLKELGVSWAPQTGGLGIWCKLPKGVNDMLLYENLKKKGVLVCPGKVFFPNGTDSGSYIRLSFSAVTDEEIENGMKIVYDQIEKLKRNNGDEI